MEESRKPLGIKSYGSIAHLPGSRMGPGDHKCHEGQKRIATEKTRDRHDQIIVQEKLDGSNVGVARLEGALYPLTRAGYLAQTSPYEQHWHFAKWVERNRNRFVSVLSDGERLCGEWLMQAHGTRYDLRHEPFVAFDLMVGSKRAVYDELISRASIIDLITPTLIHRGSPLSVEEAMFRLGAYGFHGATDAVEGAVWRVERNELINPRKGGKRRWVVDYLIKYVRPDKIDGCFLPDVSGGEAIWNWQPD